MEVVEYYNIFNYGPPISQKEFNSRYRKIVSGPGVNPPLTLVFPGVNKEKVGQ